MRAALLAASLASVSCGYRAVHGGGERPPEERCDVELAMVVPRSAMHGEDAVWVATMEVVDGKAQRTLHRRRVEVLRVEHDRVLLRDGVAVGDSVCVTALDSATDGMRVRVVDAQGNEQVR